MKKLLPVISTLLYLSSFSQIDSATLHYQHLDTIEAYIGIALVDGPNGYFVNEKKVDKRTYDVYKKDMAKTDACKPCWVKNYTVEGEFVSEGVYYVDCVVGSYIEYYTTGIRKVAGHYKENHTGSWGNIYQRGYCNVMDGDWIYYNESGRISKQEKYKDGKLVN